MNKYLFLDIDGVLNSYSESGDFLERCVKQFNRILAAVPETKIVVSSTWRLLHPMDELLAILQENGCVVGNTNLIDFTPDLSRKRSTSRSIYEYSSVRGKEVKSWLEHNAEEPYIFACLEDDEEMLEVKDHVFWCDSDEGLTEETANRVIAYLGDKE